MGGSNVRRWDTEAGVGLNGVKLKASALDFNYRLGGVLPHLLVVDVTSTLVTKGLQAGGVRKAGGVIRKLHYLGSGAASAVLTVLDRATDPEILTAAHPATENGQHPGVASLIAGTAQRATSSRTVVRRSIFIGIFHLNLLRQHRCDE